MLVFMQLKKILNIKNSYQPKRLGACWENQGIWNWHMFETFTYYITNEINKYHSGKKR